MAGCDNSSTGLTSTNLLVPPEELWFWVVVPSQVVKVMKGKELLWEAPVSTSAHGCGEEPGSLRTPRGWHRIYQKIGDGQPIGAIFKGRQPTGAIWNKGTPSQERLILTRILWLEGIEEHNRTTRDRWIYFHGTNWEEHIGTPTSCGCICLRNEDMMRLYEFAQEGTLVYISA
ncbi:L,D-transpeptidase [Candidatus Methylacidithermus pantelleriae]|uniref:YkuD domain-containing protein n=1 Tax=Candidatus Methylacidithermus pantelleriae TaxID=2744239 RepID=A0A8J2BSN1_9BACT|nr:L,D-transpeptidase [Candidatus Methylacidithermus pantelleriae]CAF0704587.1 YkuD domain-containing protein [Candidatus Methylacidithermus pantelleriae]